MVITHVHLANDGLNMFLGSIEVSVMTAAWRGSNTKASIYRAIVRDDSNLSYSSVSTVIDRLVEKKLLKRTRRMGYTTTYTPAYSTEKLFVLACIQAVFVALTDCYDQECEIVYKAAPFAELLDNEE